MPSWWWRFDAWIEDILSNLFPAPTYDRDVVTLSMNQEPPEPMLHVTNQERLYNAAKLWLGRDASPADITPDMVACVDTLTHIIRDALPELHFPLLTSTRDLFVRLSSSPSFTEVAISGPGDIILCVSGTGNGKLAHGHTGIVGKYGICSNDSRSGLFLENYSLDSWNIYFHQKGGFPVHFFRVH